MRGSLFPRLGVGMIAGGLIIGLLSGCGSKSGTLSTTNTGGLSRSYRYTLQINAFLAPPATTPVQIEVRDGSAISVTPVDRSVTIDRVFFERYDTIPKLQKVITEAKASNAYSIDATYDQKTGVPTSVYIDYVKDLADDELGFTVKNYTPL